MVPDVAPYRPVTTRGGLLPPGTNLRDMDTSNTYLNALIGAVAGVVLSFLPFSPVLGGAAAGYLERRDGLRVGTIAGLFMAVPFLGLLVLFGGFVAAFLGFGDVFAAGSILVVGVVVFLFTVVYTVLLSAVGGLVGVYVADEFRDRPVAQERLVP
jgi:hypothetical protein